MIALLIGCLLAVLWWLIGSFAAKEPEPTLDGPSGDSVVTAASPGELSLLPPNTVATRTQAPSLAQETLAAMPTAWVRVVDHSTASPVPGAAIRSLASGVDLAFTDEQGCAALPLSQPQQLAVVVEPYLLRLLPANLESTAAQPQEARLVRDRWSARVQFELRDASGKQVDGAYLLCEVLGASPQGFAPPAGDAVATRAWSEHQMLARLPVFADVGVVETAGAHALAHELSARGALQFLAAGSYRVRVATVRGWVGASDFAIAAAGTQRVRVALTQGVSLRGVVVGPDGAPLQGASVRLADGDPLALEATTDAAGAFALSPLLEREVQLHVRHLDHEPLAFGPVATHRADLRVALRALPSETIRGMVCSRPVGTALADAVVLWALPSSKSVTTRTDGMGRFALVASGTQPGRLFVQAKDHIAYAELVAPGASFARYELLPALPAVRVARGMTAMLCGTVLDRQGAPVPGVPVRWVADVATPPAEVPTGRRSLEGATLSLPGLTTTSLDGSFVLETCAFGSGRVCLLDDVAQAGRGLRAEAMAGQTKNGLTLRR